ncbi:MAG: pyruvate, phosphate dikinase, partial [Chloroflexi bacterium]|nr:pyruvate, phosphate dikinase [Chloroflexota bacterium]
MKDVSTKHNIGVPSDASSVQIRWLEELDLTDLPEVGGKGANLGELAHAGLPVPPGFVVPAAAYRMHLDGEGLTGHIANRLVGVPMQDVDSVSEASLEIMGWIDEAPMPELVSAAVRHAYRALARRMGAGNSGPADFPVAVRSSATAEDLPTASFAGQQESYLNVRDAEAVLRAVRSCWASLWTPQAISYRESMGFDHAKVELAVVVQAMVPAEVAGVMFTANPVSGDRDEILISASYGL